MLDVEETAMVNRHTSNLAQESVRSVENWLSKRGWTVEHEPSEQDGPDLSASNAGERYLIEVKSLSEGRTDRVIPLLSQAILQAQAYAQHHRHGKPMAVAYVERASMPLYQKVLEFVERFAPSVAVGVLSSEGLGFLKLGHSNSLEIDDRDEFIERKRTLDRSAASFNVNLFSDLNQWLLKVLLAPEIPEGLLNAPRSRYRNGAELASAAKVSEMSVSRFLQQLKRERFLSATSAYITLVQREELFAKWRSVMHRSPSEMPMRFLMRSNPNSQLAKLVNHQNGDACIGLFAAADAMNIGHVHGVPPHVVVPKLPATGPQKRGPWGMVAPCSEGSPDFILRQTLTPQSTLRGAVHLGDFVFTDIIQTWLDVSNHPARGQEQADLIYRKVLQPLAQGATT